MSGQCEVPAPPVTFQTIARVSLRSQASRRRRCRSAPPRLPPRRGLAGELGSPTCAGSRPAGRGWRGPAAAGADRERSPEPRAGSGSRRSVPVLVGPVLEGASTRWCWRSELVKIVIARSGISLSPVFATERVRFVFCQLLLLWEVRAHDLNRGSRPPARSRIPALAPPHEATPHRIRATAKPRSRHACGPSPARAVEALSSKGAANIARTLLARIPPLRIVSSGGFAGAGFSCGGEQPSPSLLFGAPLCGVRELRLTMGGSGGERMVRSVADRAFLPAKSLFEQVGDMMILTAQDDRLGDPSAVPLRRRVHRPVPLRPPALLVPDDDLDRRPSASARRACRQRTSSSLFGALDRLGGLLRARLDPRVRARS